MLRVTPTTTKQDQYLSQYLDDLSNYCPYITPSLNNNHLHFLNLSIDSKNFPEIIFLSGSLISERILYHSTQISSSILYSENFLISSLIKQTSVHPFEFPHWALKCLYRQYGLAYGKFILNQKPLESPILELNNPLNIFTIRLQSHQYNEKVFFKKNQFLYRDFLLSRFISEFSDMRDNLRNSMPSDIINCSFSDLISCGHSGINNFMSHASRSRYYDQTLQLTERFYGI